MNHKFLSKRVNNLSESATLEMTRKSRQLKEQGHDVINLSIGEPDFNTPECIKNAAIDAINENITHYTPVSGYKILREAIAEKFKNENGLEFKFNQIVVSCGAKQSIANTILCLVNHGDEVLIPAPFWVSYPEMAKLAGGKPVIIQSSIENDFKVTPEQVKAAITPKTKIFLFSSPCNPSGSVYTKEELKALAEVLAEKEDLFIISDEIYEYINFNGHHESIAQFDILKDRVITINGVSKGFAMTGWRIGYIGAPEFIAKACDTLQGQTTSGASSISQMAALKALKTDVCSLEEMQVMKRAFEARRNQLVKRLNNIPGIKSQYATGRFLCFPGCELLLWQKEWRKNH